MAVVIPIGWQGFRTSNSNRLAVLIPNRLARLICNRFLSYFNEYFDAASPTWPFLGGAAGQQLDGGDGPVAAGGRRDLAWMTRRWHWRSNRASRARVALRRVCRTSVLPSSWCAIAPSQAERRVGVSLECLKATEIVSPLSCQRCPAHDPGTGPGK